MSSTTSSLLQVPSHTTLEAQSGGKTSSLWNFVGTWQITRPTMCNTRVSPTSRRQGPWYIEFHHWVVQISMRNWGVLYRTEDTRYHKGHRADLLRLDM